MIECELGRFGDRHAEERAGASLLDAPLGATLICFALIDWAQANNDLCKELKLSHLLRWSRQGEWIKVVTDRQ